MQPEEDYEDLSPIYTDEPYLSFESEVKWLREMSEFSNPTIQEAIEEQIRRMTLSKDVELKQRASMRIELEKGKQLMDARRSDPDETYIYRVRAGK